MSPPAIKIDDDTELRTNIRMARLQFCFIVVAVAWLTRQDMRTGNVEDGTKENAKQLSALTSSVAEQGQRLIVYEVTLKAMNDKLDYLVARPAR